MCEQCVPGALPPSASARDEANFSLVFRCNTSKLDFLSQSITFTEYRNVEPEVDVVVLWWVTETEDWFPIT